MKVTMVAYILKFLNLKLLVAGISSVVIPSFAQRSNVGQTNDTLLYAWHNPGLVGYSNILPEDCYIEMYTENKRLTKGFFWGTTDEFEIGREGYTCGYFVLPMTDIVHEKDSITFKLKLLETTDGIVLNNFVKAPVDIHIRSWQEALVLYQKWPFFNDWLKKEICFSIYLPQNLELAQKDDYALLKGDSIAVRNLTNPYVANYEERKIFVLQKK